MKKSFLLLPILVIMFLLSSCKGDTGAMGPEGPPGFGYWDTERIEVKSGDWIPSGESGKEGAHFFVEIETKRINEISYKFGKIDVYLEWDKQIKSPLSHTLYHVEPNGHKWSATYTYEYEIGRLILIVSYSDLDLNRRPQTEYFYMVVSSPE